MTVADYDPYVPAVYDGAISVRKYGAVGDGVTDDRAAIAAAVVAARGKRLVFPEGNYLINTDGGSITLEEVTLDGEGVLDGATGSYDQGVNFHITGTTNSPFKVRRGVSVTGLGFYYPNQPDSASPVSYPPTFTFDFTNGAVQFVSIHRNVIYNAYYFLEINDIGAGNVGHVEITNNYICSLHRGIYSSHNSEHIRIERNNFTFGHWLAATEAGSRAYSRGSAVSIEIDKSDGIEIIDNLFYGSLTGVALAGTALCQFMNISLNKFDAVRYGVKAAGTGNFDGHILGNVFNSYNPQANTLQGRAIDIQTTGSAFEGILIEGNSFDAATEDHIYVAGNTPPRKVVIGPNNYRSWAAFKAAGSYGAVNVSGTQTSLQVIGGWFFGSNNLAYSNGIMGSPNRLQVTGATFEACQAALSVTTNAATLTGNESLLTGGATSDVITATTVRQSGNQWDKPSSQGKHAFVARNNTALTFNSGTGTDLTYVSEYLDTDGAFASPSFTAKVAGVYQFNWMVNHDATGTAGDRWNLALLLNGSVVHDPIYRMPAADLGGITGSYIIKLAVGDAVKLQMRRTAGAGQFVTVAGALNATSFSGALVS